MQLENIVPNKTIDTSGMNCPMPLLKTKKALSEMNQGEIIVVISTDPGSHRDIPVFGSKKGNAYLGNIAHDSGSHKFYIRKG